MKKALCRLLGLPETATDQEVEQAVSTLQADLKTAQNRAIPAELSTVLGLDPASGPDQTVVAVKALNAQVKSLNSTKTAGSMLDLTAFVPRADYDLALNRAETVESKLKTLETTAREKTGRGCREQGFGRGKDRPGQQGLLHIHVSQGRWAGRIRKVRRRCPATDPGPAAAGCSGKENRHAQY